MAMFAQNMMLTYYTSVLYYVHTLYKTDDKSTLLR